MFYSNSKAKLFCYRIDSSKIKLLLKMLCLSWNEELITVSLEPCLCVLLNGLCHNMSLHVHAWISHLYFIELPAFCFFNSRADTATEQKTHCLWIQRKIQRNLKFYIYWFWSPQLQEGFNNSFGICFLNFFLFCFSPTTFTSQFDSFGFNLVKITSSLVGKCVFCFWGFTRHEKGYSQTLFDLSFKPEAKTHILLHIRKHYRIHLD